MLAELDIATRHTLGGHATPGAATNAEPRPGRGAVTSGQLGKPNNDTRLPPRTVVPTNKACPEARLFPVTQACFFGSEGPANRSADVVSSTVRPGRFLDDAVLASTSASTGRHVESVGRRGRPVPRKGIPRPIQNSTLSHLESHITQRTRFVGRKPTSRVRMRVRAFSAIPEPLAVPTAPYHRRWPVAVPVAVPTSARMAALMGSGRVGHAATRAARSASGMSPSLLWSLHPALHPESALGVTALCGLGLHRGFTGLSIRWLRVRVPSSSL
jgi:hypothetical protein